MDGHVPIDSRRRYILDQLSRRGRVRVRDLSRVLHVSEVTIRNDLKILEMSGRLERVSGGAVSLREHLLEGGLSHKKTHHAKQKQMIGEKLSQLIRDGETLMINSGSTSLQAALALRQKHNLNILTNSVTVAIELGLHPTIRVILLGGRVNAPYGFTFGSDTLAQLGQYKADKVILSVDGITEQSGLSTNHAEEAEVNRMMMHRSDQVFIVADSSKLGRDSFNHFTALKDGQQLVTDQEASPAVLQAIQEMGVQVHTA